MAAQVVTSIIIPAHNEAASIEAVLDALRPLAEEAEVVVVCNGCNDDTAARARQAAEGSTVLELVVASKPAALRAGDAVASGFPRIYVDGDIVLSADGVRRLRDRLDIGDLKAVAPTPRYDLNGASWFVRSHYRCWEALQVGSRAISGTGAMAVTAEVRARFANWPDTIADDYFLDGILSDDEKGRLTDVEVVVRAPRRFAECVSRRARVHQGNLDVERTGLRVRSTRARSLGVIQAVRAHPAVALDVPAHVAMMASARLLAAWRRWRGTHRHFYRDSSRIHN